MMRNVRGVLFSLNFCLSVEKESVSVGERFYHAVARRLAAKCNPRYT